MSWADAVPREAAWFTTDTLPSFPGVPALSTANGGPFDVIEGFYQKVKVRKRSLYIYRAGTGTDGRVAMGMVEMVHPFVAHILWPFAVATGKLEDEMQNLDTAVELVRTRIRGPLNDHTHAGAFVSVAEIGGFTGMGHNDIHIEYRPPDVAVANREPLEVLLHYTAVDSYVG